MSNQPHPIIDAVLKGRFSALLITLALMFLVGPLIPGDQVLLDKTFGVFIMLVLVSCLRAIARTRRFLVFMALFTLLNIVVGSAEIFSDMETDAFRSMVLVLRSAYFVVVFFSIMRYVLDSSPVTGDKICGAISAYMMIGVVWTFVFTLFHHLDPASFEIPAALLSGDTINSTWAFYFSFVTLTTLGYGDITPLTPGVQSYAIMEAAIGQVFLAVIVARLIALHITHVRDPE
ncbi:hypothetical protein PDESU_04138 [Pontiella desulfatans]|uniref:Potassium channel domain-containing protein n=1 Tax=Pontiella desulfatans TaxID=2750659 RepID=A0A6C2U6M8_PONDE|nr:potassium channel family protein [Pontiella desulfatans]VGO15553.1 hypothetical protein PDESU_04138 [Pontiella desulfatans]